MSSSGWFSVAFAKISKIFDELQFIFQYVIMQLMDIDKKGILVVNYSERLVTLLREVRQLSELGHTIPSKILKVGTNAEPFSEGGSGDTVFRSIGFAHPSAQHYRVSSADKNFPQVTNEGEAYYRYGVMLKKVANFYNNMASQVSTSRSNKVQQSSRQRDIPREIYVSHLQLQIEFIA